MSKPGVHFKVGSLGGLLFFAAVLFGRTQPESTPVLPVFDRVLLLEDKAETSAGVSVGDLNGDGHRTSFSAKGGIGHASIACFSTMAMAGSSLVTLGTAPDRTYSAALPISMATGTPTSWLATMRPIPNSYT
jgi:hypothetical protein